MPTKMRELIAIQQSNGQNVVSARELHQFLGCKRDFTNWFKYRVKKYDFIEGQDFTPILAKSTGGRPQREYALTIDTAKELAMVEGNDKGKEARRYFIEAEKNYRLIESELIKYQSKELQEIRNTVKEIQAQTSKEIGYFGIVGYARYIGQSVSVHDASALGRKASKICRSRKLAISKTPDPRFGMINLYPKEVLKEVFADFSAM